jgi:hypothetical protein
MLEALRGIWRKGHLFALDLAVDYESYQKQIARCDVMIAEVLKEISAGKPTRDLEKPKELRHNAIILADLQKQMAQIFGKDLTKLTQRWEYVEEGIANKGCGECNLISGDAQSLTGC